MFSLKIDSEVRCVEAAPGTSSAQEGPARETKRGTEATTIGQYSEDVLIHLRTIRLPDGTEVCVNQNDPETAILLKDAGIIIAQEDDTGYGINLLESGDLDSNATTAMAQMMISSPVKNDEHARQNTSKESNVVVQNSGNQCSTKNTGTPLGPFDFTRKLWYDI